MTQDTKAVDALDELLEVAKRNHKNHREFAELHEDHQRVNHVHHGMANAYEIMEGLIQEKINERNLITQWQPIETAPRDGTDILLWCGWFITGFFKDGRFYTEDGTNPIFGCSHWMPLPPPPESEER